MKRAAVGNVLLLWILSGCSATGGAEWVGSNSVSTPVPPGVPPEYKTEMFHQGLDQKVDIVWMIDNSSSMNEEQQNIVNNAQLFTEQLPQGQVDYRMIVVTADASEGCKSLRSVCATASDPSGILDSKTMSKDEITQRFRQCAQVGESGNGFEEGIEAVRRALDPAYSPSVEVLTVCQSGASTVPVSGVRNPGFLRPDAHLQVIFVSDEEDEMLVSGFSGANITSDMKAALRAEMTPDLSDEFAGIPGCPGDNCEGRPQDGQEAYFPLLSNHYDFFVNQLKGGRKDLFTAHAIVLPKVDNSDSCHKRTNDEEVGRRYMSFAQMTGGTVGDTCSPNWGPTMSAIGLQASGLRKCFALSGSPSDRDASPSIGEVSIDGVPSELGVDFNYQSVGNQICFNEVPPAGSSVSVAYY